MAYIINHLLVCLIGLSLYVSVNSYIPGGGGTLIFFRYVGSVYFFLVLNFNIFGCFQENEYFLGYEDFVDFFGGSPQNWPIFRGHFYAF